MKLLHQEHSYDKLKRYETRSEEYELHEDFLLLAGLSETAAKAAYLLEHSDSSDKTVAEEQREHLKAAFERLESKYLQIKEYACEGISKWKETGENKA